MLTNGRVSSPGSVLIIESDNVLRSILVELLEFSAVHCWETASGYEGVSLFKRHQNDIRLVITDMRLPDHNGAIVVDELETICPDVKVIVVSGQDKNKLELQFESHPNVSVVQKPFSTFRFLNMISEQLL
jgi:CheY-like chemotaxis protein